MKNLKNYFNMEYQWVDCQDNGYQSFIEDVIAKKAKRKKVKILTNEELQKEHEIRDNSFSIEKMFKEKYSTTDKLILKHKTNNVLNYNEVDARDENNILEIKTVSSINAFPRAKALIRQHYEKLSHILGKNNFNYYAIIVISDKNIFSNENAKSKLIAENISMFYPIDIFKINGEKEYCYNYIFKNDLDRLNEIALYTY